MPKNELGPQWKGAIAEIHFHRRALQEGFCVLRPVVSFLPFDFLIENRQRRFLSVQVKSAYAPSKSRKGGYCFWIRRPKGGQPRYTRKMVDVIALGIMPESIWYLIPIDRCRTKQITLYPETRSGPFEQFRENWSIFGPRFPRPSKGKKSKRKSTRTPT